MYKKCRSVCGFKFPFRVFEYSDEVIGMSSYPSLINDSAKKALLANSDFAFLNPQYPLIQYHIDFSSHFQINEKNLQLKVYSHGKIL
jgi:hypothetical protein